MKPIRALFLAGFIVMAAGCAVGYPSQISQISSTDTLNQLSADSAPQQTVVNGWTARDYLQLIAIQNAEHSAFLYAVTALLALVSILLIRQNRSIAALKALAEPRMSDARLPQPDGQG